MIPRTFSPTTQAGSTSRIIRSISGQRSRSSPLPLRSPATLYGWQGNPPVRTSADIPSDCSCSPLSSFMSRYTGLPGQCFLKTLLQKSSFSQNATVSIPDHCAARANPPIPEKRSRCFITLIRAQRLRYLLGLQNIRLPTISSTSEKFLCKSFRKSFVCLLACVHR